MGDNNNTIDKATTQLEQTLIKRVEELEQINLRLQMDVEARELAQEGLRYGQKFLRAVISSIEDTYITVFDKNCLVNFIWGSKKLEEKYNILFQDFMGKDSDELNSELGNQIRQVFDTNQSFHDEWSEERKGNEVWWDFTLSPIRDEDNEMVAVVSATRDITENKKKEEKLRLNSQIMTNLSEGVYLVRLEDGIIVYTNPSFEKMFGYNPSEMIGKYIATVNAPTEKTLEEIIQDIMQILLETGEWHGEVRNIKKDGTHFWCYANVSLFEHPEYGRVIVSVHTDITERKQVENAIKESELKFSSVIDNLGTSIVVLNKQGRYEIINKQAAKSIGRKTEDIIGKSLFDLFPKDIAEEYLKSNLAIIESGKGRIYQRDFDLPSGKKTFLINEQVIKDSNGKGKYLNSSSVDITERKEMDLKLKESEEKYKNLFNQAHVGIFSSRLSDGKFMECNEYLASMMGYDTIEEVLEDFIGSEHYVNNDDREKILEMVKKNGFIENREVQVTKKDGTPYWANYSVNLDLERQRLEGIVIDITKQKNSDQKLKESEEKFRTITEQSLIGISILQDGVIKYANKTLSTIVGYSIEEIMGWPKNGFGQIIYPDDLAFVMEQAAKKQAGAKNIVIHYKMRIISKSGKIKWLDNYSKSIFYNGKYADLNILVDITERLETEQKLKKSEKKFRKIVENNPDHMMFINSNGIIFDVNRLGKGFTKEIVIGQSVFSEIFYETVEQCESARKLICETLETGVTTRYELSHIAPDGSYSFYETIVSPFE